MGGHSFPSSFLTETDSNLQSLLQYLTPTVPLKKIPESCIRDVNITWNPNGKPITKYFTLRDLWLSFEKWSAYGAKTKVIIEDREDVDHFFVPSLSAIQIFTNRPPETIRHGRKNMSFKSLSSNHQNLSPTSDFLTRPYFEFHERTSPYNRPQLFDTIKKFSKFNPGLQTLTSVDLSPASWMCVAWYPICQIPNIGIPIKDFEAAFLTFHTLSSFYQDAAEEYKESSDVQNYCGKGKQSISLPPFGCAVYKFEGDIWLNHGDSDYVRLCDLYSAADSWIKQLNFEHHDFNFFTRQNDHVVYVDPFSSCLDYCMGFS